MQRFCIAVLASVLLSCTAIAGVAQAADAGPGRDAVYVRDCTGLVHAPNQINLECTHALTVKNIDWETWNQEEATGTGIAVSGCASIPEQTCPSATTEYPVRLRLTKAAICPSTGKSQYTQLQVRATEAPFSELLLNVGCRPRAAS